MITIHGDTHGQVEISVTLKGSYECLDGFFNGLSAPSRFGISGM
jgi:hypothetical protein